MKLEEIVDPSRPHVVHRMIKEASFDEWLAYLFDRPESDGSNHWVFGNDSGPAWDVPGAETVQFMAKTYEDPDYWMRRYSKTQIADGLSYTWNSSLSDLDFLMRDDPIPWELRRRAIRALVPLYEKCFRNLCTEGLSHLGECLDNPVNGVCYMLWDVCPFHGKPENPEQQGTDSACLAVMAAALRIDHEACLESALHGLGHWNNKYPVQSASIIEQWLKSNGAASRLELRRYASAAAQGGVQ